MKVLLVEDNEILSKNIATFLRLEDIQSTVVSLGKNVNFELSSGGYDVVILDLGLPDIDGITVARQIRENGKNIPILMLTARDTKWDKLEGFSSGADDYLTKPFDYDELLARIQVLVRRGFSVKSERADIGAISLDFGLKKVFLQEEEVHLSSLEFDLLAYLVRNRSKIISKEELFEKVWGEYDAFAMSRTVDVYVGYLRKKLGKGIIETVRWEGYLIN